MAERPSFLEYKQRVVYALLKGAARVGVRLRLPLKQVTALLQMAYFEEARNTEGMKLEAIADLFSKSLRTVSSLNRRFRGDFFSPEGEVSFRRAIAALVNHGPKPVAALQAAFPEVTESALAAALEDLSREGIVRVQDGLVHRNPDAHAFLDHGGVAARIDGLNRVQDVVAQAVWTRLIEDDATALARTYVFHASPEDYQALLDEVAALVKGRAIAADGVYEQTKQGQKFGITLAGAPMEEDG
jgi:hypothetical protein